MNTLIRLRDRMRMGLSFTFLLLMSWNLQAAILDRVVAVVEDGVVLQSELDSRINTIVARLNAQNTPLPPPEVMRSRVLEQLVLEQIQLQMAETMGLRVSDSELTSTMENIAARNGYSLEEFSAALKSEGVTFRQAREQIRTEILVGRVQQKRVSGRVRITTNEIDTFLKSAAGRKTTSAEHLLGHILVAFPPNPTTEEVEDRRDQVNEILAEIRNGADFRQMAVARSDGRNALEGGVIGWRRDNDLPTLAADLVPTLAVGEVTEPIETSSGFHLVTVLDRKGGKSQIVTQYQVRHILLKANQLRSLSDAKQDLTKLYERILAGEDFAVLAKAHSEDPITGAEGGELGWVSPGEMVKPFEDTMIASAVGDLSEPFQTQFGWHILQVNDTRQKDIGAQVQEGKAREILHRKEFEIELQKWLREIREEAFVEVKDLSAS